jgi:hypothetical protein
MSEGSTYLVDPYLLQRPSYGEWGAAAESILAWMAHDPSEERWFVVSSVCLSCLMISEKCPYLSPHALHGMLKSEGESSIFAADLHRHVSRLLTEARYSEESVLTEHLQLDPEAIVTRQCEQEIRDGFPSWVIALHLTQAPETENGQLRTASRPGDGFYEEANIGVSARVVNAGGIQREGLSLPVDVSFEFPVLFRPPAVPFSPTDLIAEPMSTLAAAYEIQVSEGDKKLYRLCDFSVSSTFVPSILQLHLESQPEVLSIIIKQAVRILSRQEARCPSLQIHHQRVGPGPSDPPLTRPDGAEAFRATLTKHGAGYRLLYWVKGSTYELWEVRTESG